MLQISTKPSDSSFYLSDQIWIRVYEGAQKDKIFEILSFQWMYGGIAWENNFLIILII